MLKIPGVASATLSRHSLRSLERRLLIPHHGIVFQRANSKSPQLAKTRLERRGFELPKRSTGFVGQSKRKVRTPEVVEKRQARKLKKREREAQSARDRQTRSESPGHRKTRESERVDLPKHSTGPVAGSKSKVTAPEVPEKTQTQRSKKREREVQKSTKQSVQGRQTRSESSGHGKMSEAEGFNVPIRRVNGEIFGRHKLLEQGLDVDVPIRQLDPYWKKDPPQSTRLGHIRNPDFPRPNEPHFYVDTAPPSDDQLRDARPFFLNTIPKFAFSCSHFADFPKSDVPEFAFIGRSNVGKSSLLNALFYGHSYNKQQEKELARVGARAGLTKLMNVFLAGDIDGGTEIKQHNGKKRTERWIRAGRGIAIVDMPGYGFGSHDSQGEEIIKYLSRRTQLRRTFVLINGEHGPTNLDLEMFKIMAQAGISYQIVLTKTDKCLSPGNDFPSVIRLRYGLELLQRTKSQLDEMVKPPLRDVLCVSAEKSLYSEGRSKNDMIGMNALRLAMLQAASMAREEPLPLPIAKIDPKENMRKQKRKLPVENKGKRFEQKHLREEIRKRRLEVIKQRMQDLQMIQERRKAEEGQSQ